MRALLSDAAAVEQLEVVKVNLALAGACRDADDAANARRSLQLWDKVCYDASTGVDS